MSAGSASGSRPVLVARHGLQARAREAEGLQRREVGGALHEDDVARVQQGRGDEPERLLGARRDEQLARLALAGRAPQKRSASSARSPGSPSVEEYCSARAATVGASVRANASAMSSAGNSSGAGRPPAKEITSARWVSSRMSRTGEERTSPRREESGGGGVGITVIMATADPAREESLRPAHISNVATVWGTGSAAACEVLVLRVRS